jgi:hypothetical protein
MFDPRTVSTANVLAKDGVPISDTLLFAVEEEREVSSDMKFIERKIDTKTREQGFSIEVSNSRLKTLIADPTKNPALANLWNKEISKALRHRTDFGFAAVQLRLIRDPSALIAASSSVLSEKTLRELQEDDELDNSEEAQEEIEEQKDIVQNEIDALEKRRPTKPVSLEDPQIQGYKVPRVMDPIYEYYVKFFTLPDGNRQFHAFPRSDLTANAVPIPNSRVYVFFEPDANGKPDSPFISCLSDLQQLRTYRERHEVRDWRGTYPPLFFADSPKGEPVIPNTTTISFAEAPTDPNNIPPPESSYSQTSPLARNMPEHSLQRRLAQLAYGSKYIKGAVEDARAGTFESGTTLQKPQFNSQLNRLTHIAPIDQFGPYMPLPEHVTLAANGPQIKQAESWEFNITQIMARIANITGVRPEVLTGERAKLGAEVEQRQDENDSTIRAIQQEMERFVAQIFIDIFAPIQSQNIQYAVKEHRYRIRMEALLMVKEKREETRREVLAEIDRLDALTRETGEENTRVSIGRRRTQLVKVLSAFEEPDEGIEMQVARQQMTLSDKQFEEFYQIKLEQETQVIVHFHENPTLSPEGIKELQEIGAITKENARRLLLKYRGLPESMLATEAELEAEFKIEAKHQAVLDEQKQALKPAAGEKSAAKKPKPASSK